MKKEQFDEIIAKVSNPRALYLEQWMESRNPKIYLYANATDGGHLIAKVSRRIFSWAQWEIMDRPYLNMQRWKYVGQGKTPTPKKTFSLL